MTRMYSLITVILFALTISGCGGGSGSNLSIASFGGSSGTGCSNSDPNQSCSPPGSSDPSSATSIITSDNYMLIAKQVALDLDSLLRQRPGLPPTQINTLSSLMQKIAQDSSPVCTNDNDSPAPVSNSITGTGGDSFTLSISNCLMEDPSNSAATFPLNGTVDVSNYINTGTLPWEGSASLVINLQYALSTTQNLIFNGTLDFDTQYDQVTQVLTSTIKPTGTGLHITIQTSGDSKTNTFISGTLRNATNLGNSQQTLTADTSYFENRILKGETLTIPNSFLVWLANQDNPTASGDGTGGSLQVSANSSSFILSPVDGSRMDIAYNGTTNITRCTTWTQNDITTGCGI